MTMFLTYRVNSWTELELDAEIAGGKGFGQVTAIAGFTNGEIPRVSSATPTLYVARWFVRNTFALSGETAAWRWSGSGVTNRSVMPARCGCIGRGEERTFLCVSASLRQRGFLANASSSTMRPWIRCSSMMRSRASGVAEWYQTPSGYTSAMGPCSQMRRQLTLVR